MNDDRFLFDVRGKPIIAYKRHELVAFILYL